jgi:hypothetical protein
VKLDLVFRQSDIDWLNFPRKVWSIFSRDIDHIQSGEGEAADSPRRAIISFVASRSSIRVAVSARDACFAGTDINHAFGPLVQIARAFGGLRHIGRLDKS